MGHFLAALFLLGSCLYDMALCAAPVTEFQLDGDYLIGGLFSIHRDSVSAYDDKPEALDCSSQPLVLSQYQKLQVMRFSVEEINNSSNLLPNVSLGYDIFDHCSDARSFPDVFNFLSLDGLVQPRDEAHRQQPQSRVIAVVGPFPSTHTLTLAPLFIVDLIPMISPGSASSVLSTKTKFPSFLRTAQPNTHGIEVIIGILRHFNWRWVAFLNNDDDFGIDGRMLFINRIKDTEICLAYTSNLNINTNYQEMFKQIEAQKIHTIILLVSESIAEVVLQSAIHLNITNKVWVAGEAWSLNKKLPKEEGIQNIGTVLGLSQPLLTIPSFSDFIYSTKSQNHHETANNQMFCSQVCNCSNLSAEEVIGADPSFSFQVYAAVYAVAHALHNTLHCGAGSCDTNMTVHPYMVLAELKKSNFTLLNQSIEFDENGDPRYGAYSIIYWNSSGDAEEVGVYEFNPRVNFFINNSKIQWHTKGEVPRSLCSPECPMGHARKQNVVYKCCFSCNICPKGTFNNATEDPYTCVPCKETEWSTAGSTSCRLRLVEYIPFTDAGAVLIMAGACAFVVLTLSMSVLFAVNYHTPVVRSAGGPMCFLILGCLSLCSLSVFFHFDKPTQASCILRFLPFVLFYTVCLACFVVRSFQIVCIFKIAAKIPELQRWWMKYHGQWLVIMVAFGIQALILVANYSSYPPQPYNETVWSPDKIILSCKVNRRLSSVSLILLMSLCSMCFIFSYMGKDLPKNYNEAKTITTCLLLLMLTWILFATVYILYRGKFIQMLQALAVLSSLYSFLFFYFLPKCYIIVFQPQKNTQQYFQGLIQNYTMTMSH